jgi:uncharacterized protein (DUF58 family)
MTTAELLQKIRRIEIQTKGLTKQFFTGQYHSSFKGRGMTFSEVREYQIGDEVRTIDWNVTARFNGPYVKVFEEERELVVMLIVDISGSTQFGSGDKSKKELALELMAVLAFSAVENNDKVGAIFVSDGVEKFIPPGKGKKHALFILRSFIDYTPTSKHTNLKEGFTFFRNAMKKRTICFVISDFMDDHNFENALALLKRKHDLVALRVYDEAETILPDLGLIQLYNAETGLTNWVNTSNPTTRSQFALQASRNAMELEETFKKLGVNYQSIETKEDYIPKLIRLFKKQR